MRILYHHRTLADGAEGIHIHEMVEAFQALGHEVAVQALATSASRGQGNGSLAAVKARLPKALFELAAFAYNIVELITLWRAIRSTKPDLMYKRHAIFDVAAIMAARRARIPVVLEVNAAYSSPIYQDLEGIRFRRLARRCEGFSVRAASLVVAVSSPLRDLLSAVAPDSKQIVVLPNGANPRRFSPEPAGVDAVRRTLGSPSNVIVGWSGILREWHGLDLLLNAVRRVPGLRLVVIGDGPDRPRIEALARTSGVAERTVFTGRVPHERMPAYLAALDIAVAADDRTGYASPMKVLEYMAAGRPVTAPRLPGIQDIIEDGVDGILFEPRNEAALAAALARLSADKDLRQRIGDRGRVKVERERNWERIAETVLAYVRGAENGCNQPGTTTLGSTPRTDTAARRASNRAG